MCNLKEQPYCINLYLHSKSPLNCEYLACSTGLAKMFVMAAGAARSLCLVR